MVFGEVASGEKPQRNVRPQKQIPHRRSNNATGFGMTLERRPTMPLEITQRETNGIYLLALKGRLVLGDESIGLLTVIDNLLASGATRMVVNLEQVHYVDSAGLGALIEMHRKTKAKGGSLKLCHLRPNLKQALEMARLLPIFETCPTETAAVASF
jgi:anti-sigma B factor antagonist